MRIVVSMAEDVPDLRLFPASDTRPPKGAWAGGTYFNTCLRCGCEFVGDKRAKECADCAYR
jgi:hypothetical protein